jgi:diguanylate cyclase (GGDEF)-like protein
MAWQGHAKRVARKLRLGFGARLAVTLSITLGLVGVVGYTEITGLLERRVVQQEADYQRALAQALEAVARGRAAQEALGDIRRIIDAAELRPGSRETLLIDAGFRVVDSHDDRLIGTVNRDSRIEAALRSGVSYAGREADPGRDARDFEFVTPVNLASGRYAFESSYNHGFFDAERNKIRGSIALAVAIALIAGGLLFYLLGGRTLTRNHRLALERATRDGLTDLGNQRAFQADLHQLAALAARDSGQLSLALFDIDDFKFLNDRHGHRHGDELLLRVAEILGQARASDRAYRVGGDEFAALLPGADSHGAATAFSRLGRSFADAGIAVSIGLSHLRPGQEAAGLRDEADAALYEAKRRGGHRLLLYEEIKDSVVITTAGKVQALRDLLEQRDLSIQLQPIWNLQSGALIGVEALARPARRFGFSSPAEAFDIAEQIGRVHELDMLCVEKALARGPELPEDALLFINIAPRTLDLDSLSDGWLIAAVQDSAIEPECVVIEITERFGGRMSSVIKSLERLRKARLKLAIDDVGAGNSGLEMLRQIQVDFVKIDRSIVSAAMSEAAARAVLLSMATFANETNALVIAEGVEDHEGLEFLRRLEDDLTFARPRIHGGQGYGLGRPADGVPPVTHDLLRSRIRA